MATSLQLRSRWYRWIALFIFHFWIVFFSGILPAWHPSENSRPAFYNNPDKALNTCILEWNLRSLLGKWNLRLSDAPIFFPSDLGKFFSEHLFGHMIYAIPVHLFGASPQIVYNLTYQLNLLTLALAASLLCLEVGSAFLPALFAGGLLVTSWFLGQIQNTGLCWALLTILFFVRHWKVPRWRNALMIALFGTLTGLSSGYLAFYTPVALLLLLVVRLMYTRMWPGFAGVRQLGVALILMSLALAPTMMSYKQVQQKYGLVREQYDTAALVLPFMTEQPKAHIEKKPDEEIAFTFLACAEVLLFVSAIVMILRKRLHFDGWEWGFATLAVLSFWMAFIEVSPYYLLARLPGFNGLRAAYRWYFFFIAGVTVVISMFLTAFSHRRSVKLILIGANLALLIFAVVSGVNSHHPMSRLPESRVYSFLGTVPPGPVCILPLLQRGRLLQQIVHADRMLYQLSYSFPMVSGYSGFIPRLTYFIEQRLIQEGPSPSVIRKLGRTGVRYIVVDNLLGDTADILHQLRSERICKILYDKDGEMVAEVPAMQREKEMKKLLGMWRSRTARVPARPAAEK